MRLQRVQIRNFRNFKDLDIRLGDQVVVVGENKVGKSNLLHALRLVLDPSLPDTSRKLQLTDFWDGLQQPLKKTDQIEISVDISGIESDSSALAVLSDFAIAADPMVCRLNYVYRPRPDLRDDPKSEDDYEFIVFGKDDVSRRFGYEVRARLPFEVLAALRDAEGELSVWRRSPLRPLLDKAIGQIDIAELKQIAADVSKESEKLTEHSKITELSEQIEKRMVDMVGSEHALDTDLGVSPTDPFRLARSIRVLIDEKKRGISDASLGCANLLLLALKSLELKQMVTSNNRSHTFFAIEEPEAHLHPHLQRLVYRDFLRPQVAGQHQEPSTVPMTTVLTTHSPHIVSVAPLASLVLLRRAGGGHTIGVSALNADLNNEEVADLERYIDVSRGEMLFAKGVVLVEGEAERFLVPALAASMGYDLDKLGITVCSVSGTNFTPYVKLLKEGALSIPFAVVTDRDPQAGGDNLGDDRALKLLYELIPTESALFTEEDSVQLEHAAEFGIFLNDWTFEVDLFRCGNHEAMCDAAISLSDNKKAQDRAREWREVPKSIDFPQLLKDIGQISKGRYESRIFLPSITRQDRKRFGRVIAAAEFQP